MVSLIQDFEADFPQKVSLKILNTGIMLNTFTHGYRYIVLKMIGPQCTYQVNYSIPSSVYLVIFVPVQPRHQPDSLPVGCELWTPPG